ncbi:hypothetical protein PGT21_026588 [Puccinia graminis f. sp. tritici]|uniref:Uncharacterized protein n=1 Tax=Puccinia graminis f. sp. tritici TaxID=56615 RepID=A0A5B0SBZ6_PUCGR|nr:hypothetical protein PGT21_026588 [Puccinia graminis f. sp. tritici]KAA1135035.1 hypothetical protein PGTUg99_013539 [Puccinia graminis f. sp. tritici]
MKPTLSIKTTIFLAVHVSWLFAPLEAAPMDKIRGAFCGSGSSKVYVGPRQTVGLTNEDLHEETKADWNNLLALGRENQSGTNSSQGSSRVGSGEGSSSSVNSQPANSSTSHRRG